MMRHWEDTLVEKKTQNKVKRSFYWFSMKEDINIHTVRCKECQKNKRPTVSPKGKLGSMLVGAPMDRLCIDIIGPLPMTPSKNRYILIVTDHFTNWAEAFGIPDQTALTVTRKLFNEVLSRLSCPPVFTQTRVPTSKANYFTKCANYFKLKRPTPVQDIHKIMERQNASIGPSYQWSSASLKMKKQDGTGI